MIRQIRSTKVSESLQICHSYVRFSTLKQDEGDSERRQLEAAPVFCKQHRMELSTLNLFDRGKSSFKGKKQAALDLFLKIAKDPNDGRVVAGHCLLVESIDRLSRRGIRQTQDLLNSIFDCGIDIGINTPVNKIYRTADSENNFSMVVELAAFAYSAYVYSKQLSDRISDWHDNERALARHGSHVICSGSSPCWLKRQTEIGQGSGVNANFEIVEEAASTIRYIFQKTIEGVGTKTLLRDLNHNFPVIARGKRSKSWNETFVGQLIKDRRLLGEFQPHKMIDDKRLPIGEPIIEYFPKVIDSSQFLLANQSRENRRTERNTSKHFVNVFGGLVHFVQDNCKANIYTYQQKRADGRTVIIRRLKSYNAHQQHRGACTTTVDLVSFEACVLSFLRELNLRFTQSNSGNVTKIQRELVTTSARLQEIQAALRDSEKPVASLLPVLNDLERKRQRLQQQFQREVAKGLNLTNDSYEELISVMRMADRERLRECIKRVVQQINIVPIKLGKRRCDAVITYVQIVFHDGKSRILVMKRNCFNADQKLPNQMPWHSIQNPRDFATSLSQLPFPELLEKIAWCDRERSKLTKTDS